MSSGLSRIKQPDQGHRRGRARNEHVGTGCASRHEGHMIEQHERDEDDLSRGAAAAEYAHCQSAPGVEPAMRHRGGQDARHATRTQPHQHAPCQPELPQLAHESRASPRPVQSIVSEVSMTRRGPYFIQKPARHRSDRSVEQKIEGYPEGDGRAGPPEVRLERVDQHGGNHPDAGPVEAGEESDGDDQPSRSGRATVWVDAAWTCGLAGWFIRSRFSVGAMERVRHHQVAREDGDRSRFPIPLL